MCDKLRDEEDGRAIDYRRQFVEKVYVMKDELLNVIEK